MDRVWLPVQALAIVAAVLAPFLFRLNPQSNLERGLASRGFVSAVRQSAEGPKTIENISSFIFRLPRPSEVHQSADFEVTSASRQLRFELAVGPERTLASVDAKPTSWKLSDIRRYEGGRNWSPVEVVGTLEASLLSSPFIELDEGLNRFHVTFKNRHGEKVEYEVRVRFLSAKKQNS